MAHRDGRTLWRLGPDAEGNPRSSNGPDDVAPESDEDCAEHVEGEKDGEALPGIVIICFCVALGPVVVYRDAILSRGSVSAMKDKRSEGADKIETGRRSVSGRMRKRRSGAWMSAVSSGRASTIG